METQELRSIDTIYQDLLAIKKEMAEAMKAGLPEVVEDYTFTNVDGNPVKLSELFGDKSELLVIHNMGSSCPYCSLWADGLTGFTKHILERTAFALCSADDHATAKAFSEKRGWNYPVVSGKANGFAQAMGFESPDYGVMPGVSAFHKAADGTITRTGKDHFGPGDSYCGIWPLFDLLEGGAGEWEPKP